MVIRNDYLILSLAAVGILDLIFNKKVTVPLKI
jgi:hypothetical protein